MEVLGMVKEARSPNDAELGPCGMETDPCHLAINARLAGDSRERDRGECRATGVACSAPAGSRSSGYVTHVATLGPTATFARLN